MSARPTFPASSSDFALPAATSSSSTNISSANAPFPSPTTEDVPLVFRFRRPSLLAPPKITEARPHHSPLATSFTLPLSRRYSTSVHSRNSSIDNGERYRERDAEESESEKDKMWTDSPPDADSGTTTPSLTLTDASASTASVDSDTSMKTGRARSPSTPPPKQTSKNSMDGTIDPPPPLSKLRRLSHPIKIPRILTLLSEESRPEENEVKSEAQFQRFVASCSDQPLLPRTPRAPSDRGRYPEEADTEEPQRDGSSTDDEDDDESGSFAYTASEPINIVKPITPAQSVNGDEYGFAESPGGAAAMDIDFPSSSYGSPNMSSWRYTPPPTTSAVRSNKRKFDDRYDPYPTANKRRAVSPSVTYLRESQPSLFNPRTPTSTRHPMPLPISIPNGLNSGASSPVVSNAGSGISRTRPLSYGSASAMSSAMSSPTLRAQMGLASPIMTPMLRARKEGDGKEVDGAGEAVNGLSLE